MLEKITKYFQNNHQNFWIFIPFFLSICCFINTLNYGFVYDDVYLVVKAAPVYKNWTFENIKLMFSSDMWEFATYQLDNVEQKYSLYYRPILMFELMLISSYAGLTSWKWHLSCVLLHAVASMLAYQLVKTSIEKTKIVDDKIQINRLSLFAAVVFAIHPAQSESVAWISALGSSLVAIKIFACLLFYLHIRDFPIKSKSFIFGLSLSLLVFLLALLTKEFAVVIPIILFCYEVFLFGHKRIWNKNLLPTAILEVAFFIIILIYSFLRFLFINKKNLALINPDFPEINNLPFFVSIYTFPSVVFNYIKILIYPFNLIPFYPVYYVYQPKLSSFYFPLLCLLIIFTAILIISRNNYITRLGLIWLVIPILPVLDARLFVSENLIHDRYLYFSLVGAGLLLCQLIQWLNEKLKAKESLTFDNMKLKPSILLIILVVFSIMVITSIKQNNVWLNEREFWSATSERFPDNCIANIQLARLSINNQLYDQAINYYEQAKKACPNSLEVQDSLGFLYVTKKDFVLAETYARRVIELSYTTDKQVTAYLNLGFILEQKADKQQAIDCYQKALKLDPDSQKAKDSLNRLERQVNK